MARPVVVTASLEMSSSPERVWPLLTDTDRTNRLIGSKPVEFVAIDDAATSGTSARFVATTVAGGFKLAYEEAPFEWTHGKSFSVQRKMRSGPISFYSLKWTLEPADPSKNDGGTRATVRLEIVPRFFFLWPIAWLNARAFTSNLIRLASGIDAHLGQQAPSPYLKPVTGVNDLQLDLAVGELKKAGLDEKMAERLGDFVRNTADADLVRIRPFEIADQWAEDRRAVLRGFLRAVPAGLVELRWGLICPSCLTASQQVRALEDIALEGHCQLCDISFELDLDQAVEATFIPHPSVRSIPEQLFCIGGPARTPHVLSQANLDVSGSKTMEAPSTPGRYRLFARGGGAATLEVDEGAAKEQTATIGANAISPARIAIAPGGALVVTNETTAPRHAKIERIAFANAAATAHLVTTIGEFRTLFTSELLERGTPLKVARAAILFSDLTGSTALYSQVGDAAAFRLVDDHFDVLRKVVDEHGGAFVKTMGDAVLASFSDAAQCARAAVDALTRFEEFRAKEKYGELIGLKLGMYAGPCYVVTANGALDYFGQTVNVASRVQHLAGSGEIVLSRSDYDVLPEGERAKLMFIEEFSAKVKGVEAPLVLVRTRLASLLVPLAPSSMRKMSDDIAKV